MDTTRRNPPWNENRLRIAKDLLELDDPTLGQMYERCVNAAFEYYPSSDSARTDLSLLSHAIRELINSLPEYIGGSAEIPKSMADKEDKAREHLLEEAASALPNPPKAEAGANNVIIPASLAAALDSYRKAVSLGSENGRRRDSIIVRGYPDPDGSSMKPWSEARKFFMCFVHLPRGNQPVLPTRDEVMGRFSDIENVLLVRLGNFFAAKQQVSGILGVANLTDDGSNFVTPSDDEVRSAMTLTVGDPTLCHVFYMGLENPRWFEVLKKEGAFGSVPNVDERTSAYCDWPEGIYLRKVAGSQPNEVTEILCKAGESKNPLVRRMIIEIAPELTTENMAKLSKIIGGWTENSPTTDPYFWTDSALHTLIEKLLTSEDNGAHGSGVNLVRQCFMPRPMDDALAGFSEPSACVPEFEYADHLAQASMHLSLGERHKIYEAFLTAGLGLLNHDGKGTYSKTWIPSIADACQSSGPSILNPTIRLLASDLEEQSRTATATFKKSFRDGTPSITQRTAMHALTSVLTASTSGDGQIPEAIRKIAREILLSGRICDDEYEAEYYPLLKASIVCGVVSALEVEQLIEDSYPSVRENYRSFFEKWDEDNADARADEDARRWQHEALSLVGPELLDDRGKLLFNHLTDEFGAAEYSTDSTLSDTITGPNSPLEAAGMSKMTPDELLGHLESWHPTKEDSYALISHEGQGRALAELISKEPMFLRGEVERMEVLRPTYRRAVMDGWRQALNAGVAIPSDDFIRMALDSSRIEDDAKFPSEGDRQFDDDGDFQGLKRAVAGTLKALLDSNTKLSAEDGREVLDALVTLSGSPEPDPDYERGYGGAGMDPLTMAINTIRPLAIQSLGKWVRRFHGMVNVDPALDAILRACPTASASLADAAAIGLIMPSLFISVPEWVEGRYGTIFGHDETNAAQQVVLTTVLAQYRPSAVILSCLRSAMSNALDNGAESYSLGLGQGARQDGLWLIGDWLYLGYASGFVDDDDTLLATWRDKAGEDHLGSVLNHACRLLAASPSAPAGVVDRMAALWDYHETHLIAEVGPRALHGIEMLVKSHRYPPSWWGPRMLSEFSVNPPESHWPLTISDELESLSDEDPLLALDILGCMLESADHLQGYAYKDVAVPILANARKAGGASVNEKTERCMDRLGRAGWANLDELVKDACSSSA